MHLEDRTIVVTGASSGLGKAMAAGFVSEGARVVCASLTEKRLTAAVSELTAGDPAGDATAVPTDVRSWPAVQALFETARERYGPVDVLVNNAAIRQWHVDDTGGQRDKPVQDVPVDVWDAVLDTNLGGVYRCSKAVLPGMLSRDEGRLVHVASSHGAKASPNYSPYVASKWGLEGFHETLSLELADTGVDSLTLRPPGGGIYTERRADSELDDGDFAYSDTGMLTDAAVRLAAGDGRNGGRYVTTADGEDFTEYSV